MTDKTEMPDAIYAYPSTIGINADTSEKVDVGYQGTGTWIDFDDSCKDDVAVKYLRADRPRPEEREKALNEMEALKDIKEACDRRDYAYIHEIIDHLVSQGIIKAQEGK